MLEGIVMTTGGDVREVEGPNLSHNEMATMDVDALSFNLFGDTDLATITTDNVFSVGVLEFDFTPTGTSMEFKYIWSSEEYPVFVNSINDAFGFFVTKVGSSDPAVNIALLPDGSSVSIDNVNSGDCSDFSYLSCPTDVGMNEEYFIKNGVNEPTSLATSMNGHTTVLTARYENLVPCETYHLKLVLGNAQDHEYGSAVFIQAQSLTAGAGMVLHSNGVEDANGIFKDCMNNTFIRLTNDEPLPITVDLEYSSDIGLINGTHYTTNGTSALPLSVTVPANGYYDIHVRASSSVSDGAYFDVKIQPACVMPKRIYIYGDPSMTLSTVVKPCFGSSNGSVTVTATGGSGDYEYSLGGSVWQDGNTFNNLGAGTYSIGVRNRGSCATVTPVNLTVSTFSADAGPDMTTETLSGTTATFTMAATAPAAGESGQWAVVGGASGITIADPTKYNTTVTMNTSLIQTASLQWTLTNANNCPASDIATITYEPAADVNDLATVFEYNSTSIDIFANDALPAATLSGISSVLSLVTQQPKAGVLSANGHQIIYKHTDAAALTHHVDSFSYHVNVGGTNLDAKVFVYVIRSTNGNLAVCKGSNYSITLAGTNVTYAWYDMNNVLLSTGATFTRSNMQDDIHLGVAPTRTVEPYRNLAFPAAPLTVKVVNPDGLPATMRWTGVIDTCWHNPGNWVQVVGNTEIPVAWIPTFCVNVVIPSDAPNYPMMVADGTCNDIEMQDRAMLAGIDRLTYQNASVEIKLAPSEKDRFVMWSAPLKAMYSGDYHYKTGGVPHWGDVYMNLFQLAHPAGGAGAQANRFTATFGELGEPLSLGKAFNVRAMSTTANNGSSFVFPQTVTSYTDNKGTVYSGLTRTDGHKFIVDQTQALIARQFDMPVANDITGNTLIQVVNPYMAYLDVKKFLDNNSLLGTSYAVWNGNVNESFIQVIAGPPFGEGNRLVVTSSGLGWEASGLIPPLQSFFVTKTGTALINNVKMSPDWTTTVGVNPYALRSASDNGERNILRVKASQDEKTSYAVLHNMPAASSGYSEEKDMPKLFYDAIPLEVYILSPAGEPLAIYSIGDFAGEVKLGLKVVKEGEVTLEFNAVTGFGHDVYLIDKAQKDTSREIDLQKNPSYTFVVTKEKDAAMVELNDRFSLRFVRNAMGISEARDNKLKVTQKDGQLEITSVAGPINTLHIYNANGSLMYGSTVLTDQHKVRLPGQQIYMIKAVIENKEFIQKVFMK